MKEALLVIDNRNVQNAIEAIFEEEFSDIIACRSVVSSALFSTLNEYVPDIIVLLTVQEGRKLMDIIRVIRREAEHEKTPIIVLGESEMMAEALFDIGASVVLGATFSQSELVSRVEHLLGMKV